MTLPALIQPTGISPVPVGCLRRTANGETMTHQYDQLFDELDSITAEPIPGESSPGATAAPVSRAGPAIWRQAIRDTRARLAAFVERQISQHHVNVERRRELKKMQTAERRRERDRERKRLERLQFAAITGRTIRTRRNLSDMTPAQKADHKREMERLKKARQRAAKKISNHPLYGIA